MGMLNKAKESAPPVAEDEPAESAEPTEAAVPPEEEGVPDEGGEDMPASLQPEYKRCVAALYQVLYQNDQTARDVVGSLDPSPEGKVESVARTAMLLMNQLEEKLNMQGEVIPYMLLTVVDRLVELMERAKQTAFSEEELMAAAAAAFEGAKALFPTEQQDPNAVAGAAGAPPGSIPPGAAEAAPAPAEAPEAAPTEEEVA